MPRRRHDLQREAPRRDAIAVSRGTFSFNGCSRVHGRARGAGQDNSSGRVVGVSVGQDDGGNDARRPQDGLAVGRVLRPRVHDYALAGADHPGVGSLERVRTRIGGQNPNNPEAGRRLHGTMMPARPSAATCRHATGGVNLCS